MNPMTRSEQFQQLFSAVPVFRWKQIEKALFDPLVLGWQGITVLPQLMRDTLEKNSSWVSWKNPRVFESARHDTFKAMLTLIDDKKIETVLMKNPREQWTICVSSQVGCAMKCGFCATGKMGLLRNLTSDEIVDQYRFCQQFLRDHPELPQRISNVVFMGMGEPLANYDNVKKTLQTWLAYTDLGPTRITVSSVGILPLLEKLLKDGDWPHVRLAISLHSADPITRKALMPTSHETYIDEFQNWAKRYLKKCGNRRHHLTFEYVMLRQVNDTDHHADVLGKLVQSLGKIKVNLIPYNFTDLEFQRSLDSQIERFKKILENQTVEVTVRRTMGDDIAAACGQLITQNQ